MDQTLRRCLAMLLITTGLVVVAVGLASVMIEADARSAERQAQIESYRNGP